MEIQIGGQRYRWATVWDGLVGPVLGFQTHFFKKKEISYFPFSRDLIDVAFISSSENLNLLFKLLFVDFEKNHLFPGTN